MRVIPFFVVAWSHKSTELAPSHANVWVPIRVGHHLQYFNPDMNKMADQLPAGAELAPEVSMLQTQTKAHRQEPIMDAAVQEAGVDVSQVQSDAVHSIQANTDEDTITIDKKSCYPHCTWNCTQPVCNQDCSPDCEQPRCQTRCPRPDYSQCKIDCETPHCTVFCPKDACQQDAGETCSAPKCSTQCARPICRLKCADMLPCQNICHPPRCTWNCKNPKECAKPECRLVCEKPLGCASNYELPPLSPSLTVQRSFQADRARWITYAWEQCQVKCGKSVQTRKVVCSTGEDHECAFAPKPPTQQSCEDYSGCNKFITSEWGKCSTVCGRGMRTRTVRCSNQDERECLETKPHSQEKCVDEGVHCHTCRVTLFGGSSLDGWKASFSEGNFKTQELMDNGAKCEETSSAEVEGVCCRATLFQYGDFNRRNAGWKAHLRVGKYDSDALGDAGAEDNDVSSMKIHHVPRCSMPRAELERLEKGDHSGPGYDQSRPAPSRDDDEDTQSRSDDMPDMAISQDQNEERRPVESDGGNGSSSGADVSRYPWWFWVVLGLLVVAVVAGVFIAIRRRP
mmetsp:Transcript_120254/g.275447  ORF Transcript_120254/g.275447 Transcript_120254/m.275447 type:complete len:567 (-) Transcript_120254:28-1728(-)